MSADCATSNHTERMDLCDFLNGENFPPVALTSSFAFFDQLVFPATQVQEKGDLFFGIQQALKKAAVDAGSELISGGMPFSSAWLEKAQFPQLYSTKSMHQACLQQK